MNLKIVVLKRKIEKIREKASVQAGAQDYDVAEFVNVVLEYSKLTQFQKNYYYNEFHPKLVYFFNTFKKDIADCLSKQKDGVEWGNFVSVTLFGKPWDIKIFEEAEAKTEGARRASGEIKSEKSLITAMMAFTTEHNKEIRDYMENLTKTYRHFIFFDFLRDFKGKILADARAVLDAENNLPYLEGELAHKELIFNALVSTMRTMIERYRLHMAEFREEDVKPAYDAVVSEIKIRMANLAAERKTKERKTERKIA